MTDAERGLLAVNRDGSIDVLAIGAAGLLFGIPDDVEVAPNGIFYFSDASWKFPLGDYRLDMMEHAPNGRLLAYDPSSGRTRVLLDALFFANGIAVDPKGQFVLVVETGIYRVTRYWLEGPKKGTHDVFIDNLPAFPDGISSTPRGTFWLALISPRDPTLDEELLPRPFLRKVLLRLPSALLPAPKRHAAVLGLDCIDVNSERSTEVVVAWSGGWISHHAS